MDLISIERNMSSLFAVVAAWWNSGSSVPMWIWIGSGLAFAAICAYSAYWLMRRAIGHERINGVWIGMEELNAVLDRLQQKERDNVSMTLDDIKLLDRYRPDRHDRLQKLGEKEYVDW